MTYWSNLNDAVCSKTTGSRWRSVSKRGRSFGSLLLFLLLLSGCISTPELTDPTDKDCLRLGVMVKGNTGYMGDINETRMLHTYAGIEKYCSHSFSGLTTGCVRENDDGTVNIYYLGGPLNYKGILAHEICHQKYGMNHNSDYVLAMIQGWSFNY